MLRPTAAIAWRARSRLLLQPARLGLSAARLSLSAARRGLSSSSGAASGTDGEGDSHADFRVAAEQSRTTAAQPRCLPPSLTLPAAVLLLPQAVPKRTPLSGSSPSPSGASAVADAGSSAASAVIASDVSSHRVFLYMKGDPAAPKCGFSANVVRLLQHLKAEFASRDVLSEPAVREAVKRYSDWPTLPQLYIAGEFIGGSDIITQMFKSGELEKMLSKAGAIQSSGSAARSAAAPQTEPAAAKQSV